MKIKVGDKLPLSEFFYLDENNPGPTDNCTPESEDILVEPTITDGCFDLVSGEYYVITTDENGGWGVIWFENPATSQ